MKLPTGCLAALEAAINNYLRLDPDTGARMARLDGKCIALHIPGPDVTIHVMPSGNSVHLLHDYDDAPATTLSGSPLGMLQLAMGERARALFSGKVTISGDIETGQAFQAVLDDMDIDWEEHLSRLTGDIVAHRLGNAARTARDWLHDSNDAGRRNLREYLQEEVRVTPARIEIENFIDDVTRLSIDTERLAARVRRLQSGITAI